MAHEPKFETCATCNGIGFFLDDENEDTCDICDGTGCVCSCHEWGCDGYECQEPVIKKEVGMISKLQETKRKSMANKRMAKAKKCSARDHMEKLLNVALHLQTVFMEEYTDEQRGEEDVYFVGINEGRVSLAQELLEIMS